MSNVINTIQCADTVKNTGICDCYFDPKNITGAIFVPMKKVFAESELADAVIAANFNTAILAAKSSRIFPFTGFVGFTDSSEDAVQETFGFGESEMVREGNYKWVPMFRKGGVSHNNALRSFNGKQNQFSILFIDAENTLIGTKKMNPTTGAVGVGGIPLDEIYTYPFKINDGSKVSQFRTMLNFKPKYINELLAFVKVDSNTLLLSDLNGLQDITLAKVAVANANVTVGLTSACGDNLYDTYSDEIAAAAAFVVNNAVTGAVCTVTGVTKNAGLKAWVLALDTTDTDLPAIAGKYNVSLASTSILNGLGIAGYEGVNILSVTRPA